MSTDKRSTHTDALDTLGTAPIPANAGRDAIHLAVEPAVAAHTLRPGEWVARYADGRYGIALSVLGGLGIVDPFLKGPVGEGERFWLIVPPRQITSLRHVWEHPNFPEEAPATFVNTLNKLEPVLKAMQDDATRVRESEAWIKAYMRDSLGVDPESKRDSSGYWEADYEGTVTAYDFLMERARRAIEDNDDWLNSGALDQNGNINPEFWRHFEIVTGVKVPATPPSEFTCSC